MSMVEILLLGILVGMITGLVSSLFDTDSPQVSHVFVTVHVYETQPIDTDYINNLVLLAGLFVTEPTY